MIHAYIPECANIQALKNLAQNVLEQHPNILCVGFNPYLLYMDIGGPFCIRENKIVKHLGNGMNNGTHTLKTPGDEWVDWACLIVTKKNESSKNQMETMVGYLTSAWDDFFSMFCIFHILYTPREKFTCWTQTWRCWKMMFFFSNGRFQDSKCCVFVVCL